MTSVDWLPAVGAYIGRRASRMDNLVIGFNKEERHERWRRERRGLRGREPA